jgi:hypothetical protein
MMTVEAALDALKLLYVDEGPDWFVLLGISDYPILSAERVLADLRSISADALMDYRSVGDPDLCIGPAANPALLHFDRNENRHIAAKWYLSTQVWFPTVRKKPSGGFRLGRATKLLSVHYPFSPFDSDFRCFNGSHWFSANRKVAGILNNPTERHLHLRRHFRRRAVPEESYYQSVLCNADVIINRHNKRFERWNGGGAHPQWLTSSELDEMLASGCHFARKFLPNDPVLDQLDEALGIAPSPTRCPSLAG